jgi:hypothetical protein
MRRLNRLAGKEPRMVDTVSRLPWRVAATLSVMLIPHIRKALGGILEFFPEKISVGRQQIVLQ